MIVRQPRANHIAMAKGVASIVMCEGCREGVAELIADNGRMLCSECHLRQTKAETLREDKPDTDK